MTKSVFTELRRDCFPSSAAPRHPTILGRVRCLTVMGLLAFLVALVILPLSRAPGYPVAPYIDGKFLGGSTDELSFSVQPWRGYLETVPATTFLNGIGINWQEVEPALDAAVAQRLSAAGFRGARLEIGFGSLNAHGTAFRPEKQQSYLGALRAMKRNGIDPLILLNANGGEPAPHSSSTVTVAREAARGARKLWLSSTSGMASDHSGLTTTNVMAGNLFRQVRGNVVTLYKPLTESLKRGTLVHVDTLTFQPFGAPGAAAYDKTITGWKRYVGLAIDLARRSGFPDRRIKVEVWNELTFGSQFLDWDAYTDAAWCCLGGAALRVRTGSVWRLLADTTDFIRHYSRGIRVINGFSNTNFLRTKITDLPPVDGQSYHPYGTELFVVDKSYPFASDRPHFRYLPVGLSLALPEGVFSTDTVAEQLPRNFLQPALRRSLRPKGTTSFLHYQTEDGWNPREQGITTAATASAVRTKALLRGLTFWLNKGLAGLWVFEAHDPDPAGFGILDSASPGTVTTPELMALHNLVSMFSGATELARPRDLSVHVTARGKQLMAFPGGSGHAAKWYRDMFTFLPYQVSLHRFAIPLYTMSYDIAKSLPQLSYTVDLHGLDGRRAAVRYLDPIADSVEDVHVDARSSTGLRLTIATTDYPRVLVITD